MTIFSEVKDMVTMKQVAEYYGLTVNSNGMACCPFHDDRHPSMKIYKGYHCFACGAHGDAIGYVAQMFGLSQYEAACKLVEDLHLPIEIKNHQSDEKEKTRWRKERVEKERLERVKHRFRAWCNRQIEVLRNSLEDIAKISKHFHGSTPEEVFSSLEYEEAMMIEPKIQYWLDILCMGLEQDRIDLFMEQRKEVERSVSSITGAVRSVLEKGGADIGYGNEQSGRYTA